MEKKKKSWMSLLNPLEWFQAALQLLAVVFGPLLRWLGMLTPRQTDGFQNIQKEDVDDAKQLAEQQEAAVDTIVREMSPADVIRAYARADVAGRAEMDLRVLDDAQQPRLAGRLNRCLPSPSPPVRTRENAPVVRWLGLHRRRVERRGERHRPVRRIAGDVALLTAC